MIQERATYNNFAEVKKAVKCTASDREWNQEAH
jgi:hypothetical protein